MAPDPTPPPDATTEEKRNLAGGRRPRTIVPRSSAPLASAESPSSQSSAPEGASSEGATPEGASHERVAPSAQTPRSSPEDPGWSGFSTEERESLRGRWRQVQGDFVDDPNAAVRDADTLAVETLRTFQERLAEHHKSLEAQWTSTDADTEQLRHTIRRYRAFLNSMIESGD